MVPNRSIVVSLFALLIIAAYPGGQTEALQAHRVTAPTNLSSTTCPTVFLDDFNDGNAAGWIPISGAWAVLPATPSIPYGQTSDKGGSWNIFTTFYTGEQFTNFTIEVEIASTSSLLPGAYNVGVALRGDGSKNYYRVIFHPELTGGAFRVQRIVNGVIQDIVSNTTFSTPPASNALKVAVHGNTFRAYVNGQFVRSWNDNTFSTGYIGLTTENGSANFDNVRVTIPCSTFLPVIVEPGSTPEAAPQN
jgi:hypothetical protein